jgi:hypothetical protein
MNVSPDGRHVAFGLSMGGTEMPRSMILNIDTGAITDLNLKYAQAGAWLSDSSGLFYFRVREDAVPGSTDFMLNGASWLHRLGTDPTSDQIVFQVGTQLRQSGLLSRAHHPFHRFGRHLAGGQAIKNRSHRVEVVGTLRPVAQQLLGGGIVGVALGSERGLLLGLSAAASLQHAGQAEFGQFDDAVRRNQQAVRAQVAMDQRGILSVEILQHVQELVEVASQHFTRKSLALLFGQLF